MGQALYHDGACTCATLANLTQKVGLSGREIFVPKVQIRGIVLSRNTPAEKCCDLLFDNNNNSHKLSYILFNTYGRAKSFCLSFDIQFEHIEKNCDLLAFSSPDI